MTQPLAGKTALVTGGSRGIGRGVVLRLARDGANVAFTYVRSKDRADEVVGEVEALGGRGLAIQADNADAQTVRSAVDQTAEAFGGLDILVNNAGDTALRPLLDVSPEDFDSAVGINLRGVYFAAQAALAHMTEGGRIINIGSVFADHIPLALAPFGWSLYAMTKAGIAGLTRSLAQELGPRGITVNAIQPGTIKTDLISDELAELMTAQMPVGRAGQPADLASAVAYLANPEAWFITGANWNVDGGYLT
jgi:3-oxoacyl-[acyl-carrier protein] reductase